MRRKDREVTDLTEITKIIEQCDACHVGMTDQDGFPYVVPMSFGYSRDGDTITFYLHSAAEGKKLDLMKMHPQVCLQADCSHRLLPSKTEEKACGYSTEFQSVIAFGKAEFVTKPEEKLFALQHLMSHYYPGKEFQFDSSMVEHVAVTKITVQKITGKTKLQAKA